MRRDSDEHGVVGEKVRGFSWYSAAVRALAGHLAAQRALELEMMLLPPARRRWLPCHAAYAGCHKSCRVNKEPPRTSTSLSVPLYVVTLSLPPLSVSVRPEACDRFHLLNFVSHGSRLRTVKCSVWQVVMGKRRSRKVNLI